MSNKDDGTQLENGYTRIANDLIEDIVGKPFDGCETRVLLAIVRRTYGWGKKEDAISISQLADMLGTSRRVIIKTLNKLEEARVILVRVQAKGKLNLPSIIGINKNAEEWVVTHRTPPIKKGSDLQDTTPSDPQDTTLVTHRTPPQQGRVVTHRSPTKESKEISKENNKESARPLPSTEVITKWGDEDKALTERLMKSVQANYPFLKAKTQAQLEKDYAEMERLHRIDGREYQLIGLIIDWCQQDKFWKKNIRSVTTLREKFERLMIDAHSALEDMRNKSTGGVASYKDHIARKEQQ